MWMSMSNRSVIIMYIKYHLQIIKLNLTPKLNKNFITVKMWKSMSNRSMIIIYIIRVHTYMINLLLLRLIFIRTYERGSDKERLREDVLPRFRVLKCCEFLWTVFLRALIIQSGVQHRGIMYFDWWRVTIVRDIVV